MKLSSADQSTQINPNATALELFDGIDTRLAAADKALAMLITLESTPFNRQIRAIKNYAHSLRIDAEIAAAMWCANGLAEQWAEGER